MTLETMRARGAEFGKWFTEEARKKLDQPAEICLCAGAEPDEVLQIRNGEVLDLFEALLGELSRTLIAQGESGKAVAAMAAAARAAFVTGIQDSRLATASTIMKGTAKWLM